MLKKKSVRKKASKKKPARAKAVARPKAAARKGKPLRAKGRKKKTRIATRGTASPAGSMAFPRRGLGSGAAGQSGDIEGLSNIASADSESVEELAEEGQAFEAEAVRGVEDAPDPDEAEVTTHEVPADDVPREYEDEQ
jgi:hypothetical protein